MLLRTAKAMQRTQTVLACVYGLSVMAVCCITYVVFYSEEHMQRYLDEFDFRWSRRKENDGDKTVEAIHGAFGKRLQYKDTSSFAA